MIKILVIVTCLITSLGIHAQTSTASQHLVQQAQKMGELLLKEDYKNFATFTHPVILKSMGGATKMAETLSKGMSQMKDQGVSFKKVSFDNPSPIIKSGKELQATITQHTEFKLTKGRIVSTSTLIAVSFDNGANWTFVDASNKDMATMKKILPNLSSALSIPAQQPPVKYDD